MVKFVSRTEKMIALLRENIGRVVVLHMVKDGESTIQQGVLERENEELGSFVLKIERMARDWNSRSMDTTPICSTAVGVRCSINTRRYCATSRANSLSMVRSSTCLLAARTDGSWRSLASGLC